MGLSIKACVCVNARTHTHWASNAASPLCTWRGEQDLSVLQQLCECCPEQLWPPRPHHVTEQHLSYSPPPRLDASNSQLFSFFSLLTSLSLLWINSVWLAWSVLPQIESHFLSPALNQLFRMSVLVSSSGLSSTHCACTVPGYSE